MSFARAGPPKAAPARVLYICNNFYDFFNALYKASLTLVMLMGTWKLGFLVPTYKSVYFIPPPLILPLGFHKPNFEPNLHH